MGAGRVDVDTGRVPGGEVARVATGGDPEGDDLGSSGDTELLELIRNGSGEALDQLIRRHEGWVRRRVSDRVGARLRRRLDSNDVYQEIMMRLLRASSLLPVKDSTHFRKRLSVIIENTIRDLVDHVTAKVRDVNRDELLSTQVALSVTDHQKSPEERADDALMKEQLQLALLLIAPSHRHVIQLRRYEQLTYPEIAERLGITDSAARMRYQRAAGALTRAITQLKHGDEDGLLDELLAEGAAAAAAEAEAERGEEGDAEGDAEGGEEGDAEGDAEGGEEPRGG